MRIAARGGAEALVTGGAVAELQQAIAELQPHIGVVGPAHQALPEISGRRRIVADRLMRLGQAEQGLGGARGIGQRAAERSLGLRIAFAPEQHVAKLDRELRHQRRDVETAIERLDRLVIAIEERQQAAELVERLSMRRPPLDRALEPRQRVLDPAGLAQHDAEHGFDLRIVVAARRRLERRDGVGNPVLHQQRIGQNLQRHDVAPIGFEDIGGDSLGVGRMPAVESNHGPLQRFIAAARTAMGDRMFKLARHRAPHVTDRS